MITALDWSCDSNNDPENLGLLKEEKSYTAFSANTEIA